MSGAWSFPEVLDCSSVIVIPESPQQSPHLLMFSLLYVSMQIFALFPAGVHKHRCIDLDLCGPHRKGTFRL